MKDLTYLDHPILAIYPNVKGFGYAIFHEINVLKEAAMATIKNFNSEIYLERIDKMISIYQPSVVLLLKLDDKAIQRRPRTAALLKAIKQHIKKKKLIVISYTRQQIKDEFEEFQAYTKAQMNQKILKWFPVLTKRYSQNINSIVESTFHQGVYDAISLVMTYNAAMIRMNKKPQ